MNKEVLEKISAGSLFSSFSDEEYNAAVVTVIDPGIFVNGGYSFQGQVIRTEDATMLVYFFDTFGRQANSLEEVHKWYQDLIHKYY